MAPIAFNRNLKGIYEAPTSSRVKLLWGLMVFLILAAAPCLWADPVSTIPVAAIYGQTGSAMPYGGSSLRGVRLAIQEINATGGILGRPLALTELDNAGTPIGSKVAADLAINHKATAIIGPALSSNALAIAKIAQANGIPMITNIATHPSITAIGDYIFRVCINDLFQGYAMGRFARQQLDAKWAVIAVDLNSDYSIGLASAFEKSFTKLGGRVLAQLPYKSGQPHFRDLITKVLSEDPDVLFVPGHFKCARIVEQAIERGLRATPLGGDGWDHDAFFKTGGNKIKRGFFSTHWHKAIENNRSKQFIENYGDAEVSTTAAALAYDAVYLLADAIRRADSVERTAIRQALATTQNYTGVTGRLTFNNSGDPQKSVVIIEIQDGKPVYHMQISSGRANE